MNGVILKEVDVYEPSPRLQTNGKQQTTNDILMLPYTYIAPLCRNDHWEAIVKAFNYRLKVSDDKMKLIRESNELFRISNILLDDMQDDAALREGKPSAHAVHGIPNTLNSYYYASARGTELILRLNHPKAIVLYREQLLETCRARRMVLQWRDNAKCPSEEEYKEMVTKKTYGNITTQIKLAQLFSKDQTDYTKLAAIFGLYFQILDDYEHLQIKDFENEKFCEDVTLGYYNFPFIHAINTHPDEGVAMSEILRQRSNNIDNRKYMMSLIERFGSLEYTKKKLDEISKEASEEVRKLGGNPALEKFIDKYLDTSLL